MIDLLTYWLEKVISWDLFLPKGRAPNVILNLVNVANNSYRVELLEQNQGAQDF